MTKPLYVGIGRSTWAGRSGLRGEAVGDIAGS
jgi:hypothetical protein